MITPNNGSIHGVDGEPPVQAWRVPSAIVHVTAMKNNCDEQEAGSEDQRGRHGSIPLGQRDVGG
jgi:hypothetical protein